MKNKPRSPCLLLWIAVLDLLFLSAGGDLTFLQRPRDTTVNKSSEVYFVCQFGGVPDSEVSEYKFSWFKGNETIYDVNYVPQDQNPTVSTIKVLRYDTLSSNSITCKVDGPRGVSIRHTCSLNVLSSSSVKPDFPKVEMPSEQHRSLQVDTVRQPIKVTVDPVTSFNEYRWFKDDIPIEFYPDYDNFIIYTNGSLEIKIVTEGVTGGYNLQVTNTQGTVLSSKLHVYARKRSYPPSFIKPLLPDQLILKKGESATLNCSANAAPVPKIRWYRKLGDFETIVPQSELFVRQYRTSYYLRNVQENQTARCKVLSGSHSVIEKVVKIIVLEPPEAPILLSVDPDIRDAIVKWKTPPKAAVCTAFYRNVSGKGEWVSNGESMSSSAEINNLLPYTEYEFKVACSNNVGQGGNSSVLSTTTGQYKPSPPTSLHAEYRAVKDVPIVEVSWYPPDFPNGEITYYNYYYTELNKRNNDISRWEKRVTKGLSQGEKYPDGKMMVARVQAVNAYGPSDLSEVYIFPTTPGVPGIAEDFNVEVISANSVNLSWSSVAMIDLKDIKSYQVNFNESNTDLGPRSIEFDPKQAYLAYDGRYYISVKNLRPDTIYIFSVAAVSVDDIKGPFTESIACRTYKAVPSAKPFDITSRILTLNSIILSWSYSVVSDKITGYTVLYRKTFPEDAPIVPIDSNIVFFAKLTVLDTSVIVNNLEESTCYDFFVCANNAVGSGPISDNQRTCTINMQSISAPVIQSIDVINSTSVRLHWKVPDEYKNIDDKLKIGFQVSYAYEQFENGKTVHALHDCMGPHLTSCVLSTLQPDTSYAFRLSILLVSNESPRSNTYNVRTKSPEPNPPFNLQMLIKDKGIRVTWDYTDIPNHPVTSFVIKYTSSDDSQSQSQPPEFEYVHEIRNIRDDSLKRRVDFPDLQKGLTYTFRIRARNLNGYSLPSQPQIIAIPAAPPDGPPVEVVAIAISESRIFVSWEEPARDLQNGVILEYIVRYTNVEDASSNSAEQETVSKGNRVVISNLSPGATYRVRVAAKNSAGLSPWSPKLTVRTFKSRPLATTKVPDTEDPYSTAPQNVRVLSSSKAGSVKVLWDPPFKSSGPSSYGYKVFYSENPSLALNKWQAKIVPNEYVEETNLDGLKLNTLYGVRVAALADAAGSIGPSSKEILHRVGAVLHDNFELRPIKIEPTYAIFQWKRPSGVLVTQYKLRYYNMKDPNADRGLITMGVNASLCLVSELKPFTQYNINMTVLGLDEIGDEITSLSLQFTFYTKATVPKTVAPPILGKVLSTGLVNLELSMPSMSQGPVDAYQVILVEMLDPSVTLDQLPLPSELIIENDFNKNEVPMMRKKRDKDKNNAVYMLGLPSGSGVWKRSLDAMGGRLYRASIVAELDSFQSSFPLGDNRFYGQYLNAPLKFSAKYTLVLRALVYSEVIQYRFSDYMDPLFSVKDSIPPLQQGSPGEEPLVNLLWIVCIVATIIIVIVIVLLGLYLYRRKGQPDNVFEESYGGSSKYDAMMSSTPNGKYLSGPAPHHSFSFAPQSPATPTQPQSNGMLMHGGYKTLQTDDPVEKRRLNFPTNELLYRPPISINRLEEYTECLKANNNLRFYQEFKSIEPGQQFTWEHSNMEVNKPKNRYANVIAYDHSRVHLRNVDNVPGSDYINANYMDGYRREKAYISTQGPLDETLGDFWRMVWEQNSYTVVMMTKLEEKSRTKCDRYWPEHVNTSENYGYIEVYLMSVNVFATHTIRAMKIRNNFETNSQPREVRQYQFTAWPDHGVPEHPTPVLSFVQKVKSSNPPNAGPIVVHCSAGVGRTGCFIVIDTQLEKIRNEDQIDVYGHVTCLRAQRQYMVQTEDQYMFIYDAILEAIQTGTTEFRKFEIEERVSRLRRSDERPGDNRTGLEAEFERLSNVTHSPAKFASAMLPENMPKNRLANIKPFETTRVKLQPLRGQTGSDYINASFIDGYFEKGAYIATQAPLESTVFDFWRMLWEQNSCIIVMLTKLKELGREKCFQYWPKPKYSERYNFLVVEPMQEFAMSQFVMREFRVTDARDGGSRTIRQFHFDWPEQGVPAKNQVFIDFIGYVHDTKTKFGLQGPITVHCSSGSARTGVFIALKIVLDRMHCEGVVDVFQTAKMLRTQRPAMVQTEDQYEFIYQAALDNFRMTDNYDCYNSSRC